MISPSQFSQPLLAWFARYGRQDLPWQHPRSPYYVWLSEIMLQQTQVKTVIPYFERFVASFPTIEALALADEDEVFAHWAGLGYYSRARNLHKTAKLISSQYAGIFPTELKDLEALPGIGPSTAAAIASQAFNLPTPILDGNVKRVLTRYFALSGYPEKREIKAQLWQLAKECMPKEHCCDYTQAIMDLGATCCTLKNPQCLSCPVQLSCKANQAGTVGDYPEKKAKKRLRTEQEVYLILFNEQNEIYFEKRPPVGIWGGLFCLPLLRKDTTPIDFIRKEYGFSGQQSSFLLKLKHSFSHFHLEITALALKVRVEAGLHLAEPRGRWLLAGTHQQIGLAKPIASILAEFLSYQATQEIS